MRRRRKPPPDNRPDWRDPEMPIVLAGTLGPIVCTPTEATEIFKDRVAQMTATQDKNPQLYWRTDPTYNMRKKK